MLTPVVVGTNPERGYWLKDCVASIRSTSKYRRVFIHRTGGFELAALRAGVQQFRRFLFIHDSVEILHHDFWHHIDTTAEAWLFGGPPMYLGVYERAALEPALAKAPESVDKRGAVEWEGLLPNLLNYPTIWPEVHDGTGRMEARHGRMNLVLENHLCRKWKGHWGQGPL